MTMVAGCSLPSGVIIATDSRITFKLPNGDVLCRRDTGRKVFPLTADTIVGFAGDCTVAGNLLHGAARQLDGRQRDPVSLSMWLPRFLRRRYSAIGSASKGQVVFMVGSALSGRLGGRETEIEAFLATGDSPDFVPMQEPRHGLPWGKPDIRSWTECMGARNILYTVRSPDFTPRVYAPLQFAAIGTGADVRERLHRAPLSLYQRDFTDHYVNDYMHRFRVDEALTDCGGLNQILFVSTKGVSVTTFTRSVFVDGREVRIGMEHDQATGALTQVNHSTGRRLALDYPWDPLGTSTDELFDDLEEAMAAARPKGGRP